MKEKEQLNRVVREAPSETSEYLAAVNVFSPMQTSMEQEASTLPFICDPSIQLDENELKLLARGPKYMVRDDLSADDFEIELEKMIAKKKLNSAFNEEEIKEQKPGNGGDLSANQSDDYSADCDGAKSNRVKSEILWEE